MQKGFIYTSLLALLMLTLAAALPVENFTFSGKVISSDGDPLIGASILVKGTIEGCVTDYNGKFSFTNKDSCLTIIASYLGFESKESTICANGNPITIVLDESMELSEVVVMAYSPTLKRESLSYASSAVSPKSIRRKVK